jgi:hypothetical protein
LGNFREAAEQIVKQIVDNLHIPDSNFIPLTTE